MFISFAAVTSNHSPSFYFYPKKNFHELFPHIITIHWPRVYPASVDTKPSYYYQCRASLTETVDVYAEWTLPGHEFLSEIEHMK